MDISPAAHPRASTPDTATVPNRPPLAALSLAGLTFEGDGAAAAPLVWLCLCAHVNVRRARREVWPSNATIARETGLSLRAVRYGLAQLRKVGKVTVRYGLARGWTTAGRILTLHYDGPSVRLRWLDAGTIRALWSLARRERERPTTLVALAVAVRLLAGQPGEVEKIPQAWVHGLLGSRPGGAFGARVAAMVRSGILAFAGKTWASGLVLTTDLLRVEIERAVAEDLAALPAPSRGRTVANTFPSLDDPIWSRVDRTRSMSRPPEVGRVAAASIPY